MRMFSCGDPVKQFGRESSKFTSFADPWRNEDGGALAHPSGRKRISYGPRFKGLRLGKHESRSPQKPIRWCRVP
jgi:hypothetical protein